MCTRCHIRSLSRKNNATNYPRDVFENEGLSPMTRRCYPRAVIQGFVRLETRRGTGGHEETKKEAAGPMKTKGERWFFCLPAAMAGKKEKAEHTNDRSTVYRTEMKTTTNTVIHPTSLLPVKWLTDERNITQLCVATRNPACVHMFIVNNLLR